MKNTHILPTENYKQDYTTMRGEVLEVVRLGQLIINKETGELLVNKNPQWAASCDTDILVPHHIYISSDEEIKEGDWYLTPKNTICKCIKTDSKYVYSLEGGSSTNCKKIILTTDQELIKDGVQAIDDEFLQWFVKNPSCECVDVEKTFVTNSGLGYQEYAVLDSNFKVIEINAKTPQTSYYLGRITILNTYEYVTHYKITIPQELPAYKLISNYYGQSKTKRSGIPLINHIDEGIEILKGIGADEDTIEAYCLHPILQSDEEFNKNLNMDFSKVSTSALILAVEYRRVANSYLSTNKMEDFVGFTNEKIKQMLYADKIQNEKDFALYHEGKHERSKELREYFNNWLNILLK